MVGFFADVLEVEDVFERKQKDSRLSSVLWARLRLEGALISVRVKDGVKIPVGWSGKVTGTCVPSRLKSEFNGRLTDRDCLIYGVIDGFIPVAEVRHEEGSAFTSFVSGMKQQPK